MVDRDMEYLNDAVARTIRMRGGCRSKADCRIAPGLGTLCHLGWHALRALTIVLFALGIANEITSPLLADEQERDRLASQFVSEITLAARKLSIGRIRIESDCVSNSNSVRGDIGNQPVKTSRVVNWKSDGLRWRLDCGQQAPLFGTLDLNSENWSTGFDGSRHFHWDQQLNHITIGRAGNLAARQYEPRNFFWDPARRGLDLYLKWLTDPDTKITSATVGGLKGYRVECGLPDVAARRWTTFICPRRSCLPLISQCFHNEHLEWESQASDLSEFEPNLWYPKTIRRARYAPDRVGEWKCAFQFEYRVTLLPKDSGDSIPKREFALRPQIGVDVNDLVAGVAYNNNSWWSELSPILRTKLNWPKPTLARLNEIRTYLATPEEAFIAEPEVNEPQDDLSWINTPPLSPALLAGKVTLIYFWDHRHDDSLEILGTLKQLHEIYAVHGLQVIAIHGPDQSGFRKAIAGLNLPFMVTADSDGDARQKRLSDSLGMRATQTAILIDHGTQLHTITAGKFPQQVIELLTAAGARDLARVRPREELSEDLTKAIESTWLEFVARAPHRSKITGQVIDGEGQPIPNAQIQVHLTLRLLTDFGHIILSDLENKRVSHTDAKGQFTLENLAKGEYRLDVSANSRVPRTQQVVLAEGDVLTVPLRLDSSDFISGHILSTNGQPIANATLRIRYGHPDPANLDRHTASDGDRPETKTDDRGCFRLEKLEWGHYTIDIFAEGFDSAIARKVPLGRSDVKIRMTPAK